MLSNLNVERLYMCHHSLSLFEMAVRDSAGSLLICYFAMWDLTPFTVSFKFMATLSWLSMTLESSL